MRRLLLLLLVCGLLPAVTVAQTSPINGNRVLIGWLNTCTTAGTPNTYTCTLPFLSEYRPQMRVLAAFHAANTGAATFNINGIGALAIQKWVQGSLVNVVAGDLQPTQAVELFYDGTQWQALALGSTAAAGAGTSTVQEADGTPASAAITTFIFPNNSVAINGTEATITFPAGGSGTWGSITGTLSAQTDLQSALNAKLDDSQLSTDVNLGTSNTLISSQLAVKTYIDTSVASAGGGDIVSVGNCTTGACFDGVSGHGTMLSLHDGSNNKGTIQSAVLSVDRAWTLPNESGMLCTDASLCTGYGDVRVTVGQTPVAGQIAIWTDDTHIQGSATTGSGAVVLSTSPTLITPTLGVATATSINKVSLTPPATSATLTIANGKTLVVNNSLTLGGTDGSTVSFGTGGTVLYDSVSQAVTNKTIALGNNSVSGTRSEFNGALTEGNFITTNADEWSGLATKATPGTTDLLLIEDAAAAGAKKQVQVGQLLGLVGDITSIGGTGATGCTTGECLDGSSTGGTAIALYDGDSHKGTWQTEDLSSDVIYTYPARSGTVALTDGPQTLTNTRVVTRVAPATIANPVVIPGPATAELVTIAATIKDVIGDPIVMDAPTGIPSDGERLVLEFASHEAPARPLSWNVAYVLGANLTLPTETFVDGYAHYYVFIYRASLGGYVLIGTDTSAASALTLTSLNVGDLTITGDVSGGDLARLTPGSPQTMTNTWVQTRMLTDPASATAINTNLYDAVTVSNITGAYTFALDGASTPVDLQILRLRYRADGAYAITWPAAFDTDGTLPFGVAVPTTTLGANAWEELLWQYNATVGIAAWELIARLPLTGQQGSVQLNPQSIRYPTVEQPAELNNAETNARLLYDDDVDECLLYQFTTPTDYSSTPQFQFEYSMLTATTGGIAMQVSLMVQTDATAADVNTESFATANNCNDATVPATAGRTNKVTCPLTQTDGIAAGEFTKLKLCRNADDVTNDTATGDLEVLGALLLYTR